MLGGRRHALLSFGLLLLVQCQDGLVAAAPHSRYMTFPYQPPTAISVTPYSAPKPNLQLLAAPMAMGQLPVMVAVPPWQPAPVPAAQHAAAHMRMASPDNPPAQQAAAAAAHVPFAPSIPFNPSSQHQVQQTHISTGAGPVPDSYPTGVAVPAAMPLPRRVSIAGLFSSGAQALSVLAKHVLQQQQDTSAADKHQQAAPTSAAAGAADESGAWASTLQQQWQPAAHTAAVPAATNPPARLVSAPGRTSRAQEVSQQTSSNTAPAEQGVLGAIASMAAPAVVAAMRQTAAAKGARTPPATPAAAAAAGTPAASSAGAAKSVFSGARLGSSSAHQLASMAAVSVSSIPAAAASTTRTGRAAVAAAAAGPQAMQPAVLGITSKALGGTNNMGAPMAGPLGGPTYMVPHTASGTPTTHNVAIAATPAASSSKGISMPPAPAFGMDDLQKHFAGPKPPQYAPLPATLHVGPPRGSRATGGSRVGPSIDDVSAATGAPVAQVTWQLPKRVHVAIGPAAELIRAPPVSPFEMPSSMQQDSSAGGDSGSRGAVTHHLTPTWVPAT